MNISLSHVDSHRISVSWEVRISARVRVKEPETSQPQSPSNTNMFSVKTFITVLYLSASVAGKIRIVNVINIIIR